MQNDNIYAKQNLLQNEWNKDNNRKLKLPNSKNSLNSDLCQIMLHPPPKYRLDIPWRDFSFYLAIFRFKSGIVFYRQM